MPRKDQIQFVIALKKNDEIVSYYISDDTELTTDVTKAVGFVTRIGAEATARINNLQWDLPEDEVFEVVDLKDFRNGRTRK